MRKISLHTRSGGRRYGKQSAKKYGLPTAIALVVGIVIGSGVFFKAEKILTATGGSLPLGILAWAIGGGIMALSIPFYQPEAKTQ